MSICCAQSNREGAGPCGAQAECIQADSKFFIPRSWISQDDGSQRITLQVKLPGCTKDDIRVKIWNQRQLLLRATCQSHHYELRYKIPRGYRLHRAPKFASKTEMLTCQFHGPIPVCVVCRTTFLHRPILTKDTSTRVLNRPKAEFFQPRHSITYDGKMALFEAHLEGCKNSSQINFHIDNDTIMLLASLCSQHNYYLSFRLESSAKNDWQAYFDRKLEIFTCSIPLLGHYECGKCMAKRHVQAEKVVGEQTEEASSSGHPTDTLGQENKQSPCKETATCGRDSVNLSLDVVRVDEVNNSPMKKSLYSETEI